MLAKLWVQVLLDLLCSLVEPADLVLRHEGEWSLLLYICEGESLGDSVCGVTVWSPRAVKSYHIARGCVP